MKITLWKKILILSWVLIIGTMIITGCSAKSNEGANFPIGRFESVADKYKVYVFTEGNNWMYEYYGELGAEGKYKVKGNQWIEQGTTECPFPGTYEWTYLDNKLSFKLVGEDKCDPRREATDGQTFVLVR